MKRYQLFFFIVSLFVLGCKPFEEAQVQIRKAPLSPKLLTLERESGIFLGYYESKLFAQEIEQNLMDPYGDKYGTIVVRKSILKFTKGPGFEIVGSLLLGIPYAFGWPAARFRYEIEIEVRILDSKGKLLRKYSEIGKSEVVQAAYWGYGNGAKIKMETDAFNDVLDKIRPKIQAEAVQLNAKLLEAGKLH